MSQVSVIIPTMKGREDMLKRLISTLPSECETIVVDDEDLLLAGKRNKGARLSKGKYLFFIDDDNYLKDKEHVYRMMDACAAEEVGVVGMTACYDDKKLIVADGGSKRDYLTGFTEGINTNKRIYEIDTHIGKFTGFDFETYDVDEVANAFMIRRDVFEAVGGLDEENFPIDLDEADICKRIKDMGYRIVMNPRAICYHKSQTYSHIPNFRRPMNAYFMGRNRVLYQRKHNSHLRYGVYFVFFMPVFVLYYAASLVYRKKPLMIVHFVKGVIDGILGRKQNKYQKR